ncbi:nuclear transport factor 2 family protein [Calothrix sp. CCY 0018]|uniref:nuclear transport factor 2 family protein n=1 Tax=Calothrix sp. CCY 0018 TaxID=3103864 RepID=UPI0039C6B750
MAETIIERFFTILSSQGIDAALDLVTTDTVFEAQGPSSVPIYGCYKGHQGVRQFISILQDEFDTEKFEIRKSIENSEIAFAFGYMQHRVIKTDRVFYSEFALYCQIRDNRISVYKMFEDTAALFTAYTNMEN